MLGQVSDFLKVRIAYFFVKEIGCSSNGTEIPTYKNLMNSGALLTSGQPHSQGLEPHFQTRMK
jgi:hypothetical protein